jgi:hypothetical protein
VLFDALTQETQIAPNINYSNNASKTFLDNSSVVLAKIHKILTSRSHSHSHEKSSPKIFGCYRRKYLRDITALKPLFINC